MKDAYRDLDMDEVVDLLKQARAKLRYALSRGAFDGDQSLLVGGLLKQIDNTLPKTYLIEETRTIKYELEIEAANEEAALDAYRDGEFENREEVDDDSDYEVRVR